MPRRLVIEEQILAALGEYLKRDPSTITLQQSLRDDLELDSMGIIQLLFKIEEVFDLQIPDQDLQRLTTVGNVIAYVEERVQPPATVPLRKPRPRTTPKKT